METLSLLTRWVHIVSAVVLAGGIFFLQLVWLPSLRSDPAEAFEAFRSKWAKWVGVTTLLLLVTGLWNGVQNILRYDFLRPGYHGWLAVKLLLGLVVFALAALLGGRTQLARKMRSRFAVWSCVASVLAFVVLLVGGAMRSIPRVPQEEAAGVDAGPLGPPVIEVPEGTNDG